MMASIFIFKNYITKEADKFVKSEYRKYEHPGKYTFGDLKEHHKGHHGRFLPSIDESKIIKPFIPNGGRGLSRKEDHEEDNEFNININIEGGRTHHKKGKHHCEIDFTGLT